MGWIVYILRCADATLYTGVTNDLDRRLAQHNRGHGARYTAARLPVSVCYAELARDRSSAQRREAEIKRLSRTAKLALVGSWCRRLPVCQN